MGGWLGLGVRRMWGRMPRPRAGRPRRRHMRASTVMALRRRGLARAAGSGMLSQAREVKQPIRSRRDGMADENYRVHVKLKHDKTTVSEVHLAAGHETPVHTHKHDYVVHPRAATKVLKTTYKDGQVHKTE